MELLPFIAATVQCIPRMMSTCHFMFSTSTMCTPILSQDDIMIYKNAFVLHYWCLGVILSGNQEDHYILNFKKHLKNRKNLLSTRKCRNLSIKGKITVTNTLAISPLLYLANVIHIPPQVITEVKDIIVDFLWDGKPPKIAYNVLIQSIKKGGVKLIDFESKIKALTRGLSAYTARSSFKLFSIATNACTWMLAKQGERRIKKVIKGIHLLQFAQHNHLLF